MTIGVGSVINIGVVAGDGCQVGAMSLVPKQTSLEPASIYVGVPVQKCEEQVSPAYLQHAVGRR